jgi:MraZ protein
MAGFIGEFPCTVDDKGRFLLPAGLKKQVPAKEQKRFVIHRGFEKHLVLYTRKEWDRIVSEVNELSPFVRKHRELARQFHRGATELEVDGTSRLLLPKTLMEYAGIRKDIVLFAYGNRIEVWSEDEYQKMLKESGDYGQLAEEVLGKRKGGDERDLLP